MNIPLIIETQRERAFSGKLKSIEYRVHLLKQLKKALQAHEEKLYAAIQKDFRKSKFDTYTTELSLIYHEIDLCLRNIKRWSQPQRVRADLANFPSRQYLIPEPYGHCLIIAPWNYPIQLALMPAVSALAAGNVCLIKPSELTPHTSRALQEMIQNHFDSRELIIAEGGVEVTQELLKHRFDKIFFTGSTRVGKIVALAAATHLTPTTLELGGKSPCIVMPDADLDISAKRIVWGKFLNAGQTCIAPDYLLVEDSIYDSFLSKLAEQIKIVVGPNPFEAENYPRIINSQHLGRLKKLLDPSKIYWGGEIRESENYLSPTLLKEVSFENPVMQEEIFGPILPVLRMKNLETALQQIQSRPKPLAFYLFTQNEKLADQTLQQMSYGGACLNETLMQITNPNMPFGGVGESGQGNYHGKYGFQTFSHTKSVLKKGLRFEWPLRYIPYTAWKLKLIRMLMG